MEEVVYQRTKESFRNYLKNSKIYVETVDKSRQLQEKLAKLGIERKNSLSSTVDNNNSYVIIHDDTYEFESSMFNFEVCENRILKIDDVLFTQILPICKFHVGNSVITKDNRKGTVISVDTNDEPYIYTIRPEEFGMSFEVEEDELELYKETIDNSNYIEKFVEEISERLDKKFPGCWYIGGSYGLKLHGYDLGRDINDLDFVVHCSEFWQDPLCFGTDAHELLYGDGWKWNKSHSNTSDGVRCITTTKHGIHLDLFFRTGLFPKDVVGEIIEEKKHLANQRYYKDAEKHRDDLNKLKELGLNV